MMAHASAMTYTPSVNTGGKNATDTETDSTTHQSCENELLTLDISGENGTTNRNTNKRTYYERAYLSFPGDSESPKKRRKQSTPVKIPTTNPELDSEQPPATTTSTTSQEGKLETHNSSSSPALANSTTPSPDIFHGASIKTTGEEGTSPTTSNPPLTQNMHSDLFKIDFGAPSWLPDIHNKASEDWLGTPPPFHSVPFSFPSSSVQSPVLPGQIVTQYPIMDSNQQSTGHLLTRPINQGARIRIFNPDAYCELCNKEFCNKYFLKTHKANKHGIYTDLQPNDIQYQTSTTSGPSTATTSACIVTINNHTNTNKPLTLPQSITEQTTKIGSESTSSPKIASNLLLTASCDICQKKFCNQNFVKRHKIKVHGIIDDNQSNDDNSNMDLNVSDSNSETPQQNQSPNSTNTNTYYQDGLPECLKPFLDTEFDSDHLQQYRWQQSQQIREAIHRPRGLGIINPEAFCEICCKEYCNKYFLRTHKLKRHGIAIPDDPPTTRDTNSQNPPTTTNTSDSNRTIQTSPLNLIKSEQTTSSSESYNDKKDSEIMMCAICGVHVAQKYMKAHYEACHIAKNSNDNIPTASTATSSPMSTTGRQLDLNDELNTSETASNDKPPQIEDNINEDLKKLQTMILQLNNLNVCQIVSCNVCCKEFENKFYLQAHMMSDHGQLYMKITDEKISIHNTTNLIPQSTTTTTTTTTQNSNESISTPSIKVVSSESLTCSKMFTSNSDIPTTERLTPSDNYNPQTSSRNTTPTIQPTAPIERRSSISLAPTNSYCEICNKELCNKYFMKTHMQRMHGIEIENGAQIGGVVCNICNKELCSKYFLRVHKHNTHGIVEDGMPLPQSRQTNEDSNQPPTTSGNILPPTSTPTVAPSQSTSTPSTDIPPAQYQVQPIPPPSDASLKPNELGDLNHRYFAHFTEVCPICSRRFRSTKWLKAHLVTDHGKSEHDKWEELEMLYQKQTVKMNTDTTKMHDEIKIPNGVGANILEHDTDKIGIQNLISNIFGQDELHSKKYYCTFCNFSTPVLAFLFVHERSHGQSSSHTNIYQCPICTQSYQTGDQLQQHLIVQHSNISTHKNLKTTISTICNTITPSDNCSNNSMTPNNNIHATLSDTKPAPPPPPIDTDNSDTNINGTDIKSNQLYDLRQIFHTDHLIEMSQQMQLPTTYALPHTETQTSSAVDDDDIVDKKYMMQPFLIEEYHEKTTTMGIQLRLVPSLVFLPVRERVTSPLTTSIKFTPT